MKSELHFSQSKFKKILLQELTQRKMNYYNRQLTSFGEVATTSMRNEMTRKAQMISASVAEEMEPITETLAIMYEKNKYHLRDITEAVVEAISEAE